jgi:transcription elongation factor
MDNERVGIAECRNKGWSDAAFTPGLKTSGWNKLDYISSWSRVIQLDVVSSSFPEKVSRSNQT